MMPTEPANAPCPGGAIAVEPPGTKEAAELRQDGHARTCTAAARQQDSLEAMTTCITTVLFDLGGVVCRFQPERRLRALAIDCGLSEREVRMRIWESGFDRDCDLGRYTADEVYHQTRHRLGLQASYEAFCHMWALAFEPEPVVLALVDALRPDIRRGLLTDNGPVLRDVLPTLLPDVSRRFEPVLFSCELGALKPTPALFRGVLDRLNQRPEQILLVDDSPQVVQGAVAFGFQACRYDAPASLRRTLMEEGLITASP
jgi:HAD superfamily hydrolase (TIGR01509 family)